MQFIAMKTAISLKFIKNHLHFTTFFYYGFVGKRLSAECHNSSNRKELLNGGEPVEYIEYTGLSICSCELPTAF